MLRLSRRLLDLRVCLTHLTRRLRRRLPRSHPRRLPRRHRHRLLRSPDHPQIEAPQIAAPQIVALYIYLPKGYFLQNAKNEAMKKYRRNGKNAQGLCIHYIAPEPEVADQVINESFIIPDDLEKFDEGLACDLEEYWHNLQPVTLPNPTESAPTHSSSRSTTPYDFVNRELKKHGYKISKFAQATECARFAVNRVKELDILVALQRIRQFGEKFQDKLSQEWFQMPAQVLIQRFIAEFGVCPVLYLFNIKERFFVTEFKFLINLDSEKCIDPQTAGLPWARVYGDHRLQLEPDNVKKMAI